MPTTSTTNRRHLDPVVQGVALDMRLMRSNGRLTSYDVIAEALGLNNGNAAMYACERESITRVGDTSLTAARRAVRVAPRSASWVAARTFGVELECSRGTMVRRSEDRIAAGYPVHHAAEHLRAAGLDARANQYTHAVTEYWKVTYDTTVTGVEAVAPILSGDDGYRQVRLACQGLQAAGATPGGGVHVHHGVTDFTTDQLINLVTVLQAAQSALQAYVPARRQANGYCPTTPSYDFDTVRAALTNGRVAPGRGSAGTDRYRFINFAPLGRQGTVEFRGHGATLNGGKLVTWIKLGQAVIEFARRGGTLAPRITPAALADTLTAEGLLTAEVAQAYLARVADLHGAAAVA